MKKKLQSLTALAISFCLFILPLAGCNIAGRNDQNPDRNNTTQQGRNILGDNNQGANPNAGPNTNPGGSAIGGNNDAGSGTNPPDTTRIGATPGPNPMDINRIGATPGPNMANPFNQQITDGKNRADKIRSDLAKRKDMNQVNVIVLGNTALVTYNLKKSQQGANALRSSIENRVKQIDKAITDVVVTDSGDLMNRAGQLSRDITDNKPANDITNGFNQLIRDAGRR